MEIINATVLNESEKYYICITEENGDIITKIPISQDQPNHVKLSFNALIIRLKKGMFNIKMTNIEGNLYSQVPNEYINQLNRELNEVYQEMQHYKLLD